MSDGKKYKPVPPPRRWKKGESGNPKGRKKRDALIDEFYEGALNPKEPRERRWVLLERLFTSALNPSRKDHAKLLEINVHMYFGKPRERVEMSGPNGSPIKTEDATPRRRPTTGELRKRLAVLKAKWLAGEAAKAAAGAQPADLPTTTEPDEPEGDPTP